MGSVTKNKNTWRSSKVLLEQLNATDLPATLIRDHLERMDISYFERYQADAIQTHIDMINRLSADNLAEVHVDPLGPSEWCITIIAFDYMAEVSTISGLFVAHGLAIVDGDVFTYAGMMPSAVPAASAKRPRRPDPRRRRSRIAPSTGDMTSSSLRKLRKIVDIFHVRAANPAPPDWAVFHQDLEAALRQLKAHQAEDVQRQINLRVVDYLRRTPDAVAMPLFPVQISIDNKATPHATRLQIEGQDTPAFLYALSTALTLRHINIVRIGIETPDVGVRDTVDVTNRTGEKITDTDKLHELRFVIALIKQFTHLLIRAPNPAQALEHFNRLIDQVLTNVQSGREMEEIFLQMEKQHVISAMAQIFGTSDFLWEDFLRMQYKNLFPVLQDINTVVAWKSGDQMETELTARMDRITGYDRQKKVLNQYKDREMFRVDMGQILAKKEDFRAFARALTTLAEVVLNTAYRICDAELQPRYGRPRLDSEAPCEFCICALGKCGGRELGWASDIELLFVYTGQGMTDGPNPVHNSQYYERLVRMICDTVVARREGIFEIDLRLRPYGDKGALASSLDNFHEYFNEKGGALPYERQALIKLRAIGGEPGLRKQVEAARSAFVFSREPLDLNMLTHIRERQNNELVKSGTINVKYSYGGVIDIEYYVQQLQILHGVDDPALRSPNTIDALVALHQAGHIPDEDYNRLSEAYIFLRRLINALRIVRGHAKDLILPDRHSQPFLFLARRLGYADDPKHDAGEQLRQDVRRYMEWASQAHRTRFIHKLFD